MFELIDNNEDLINFVKKISNTKWVALDTEFLRERTYYAKLCLVQIEADNGLRACIDPLSLGDDLSPLEEIFNNPNIVKVFHAAHQDLEILLQLTGNVPSPIFDTQIAASVLGIGDQMGYARLVESMLNVSLSKTQSRTDWTRRPLKQAQLDYAIDDVRYLAQIYPQMLDKLTSKSRLDWLKKDFTKAVDPKTYAINAQQRWQKVRGNQVLKRPQLAVLRELAAWREIKAESRNLPRKWVISDDILLDISKQQPSSSEEISEIRGINAERTKKYHQTWLDLINTAKQSPEDEWPELPRSKKPTAAQNAVIDLLMIVIQIQANKNDITPAVIATRKQLAHMVQAGESMLSNDWRGELVNKEFERVLTNKSALVVENGVVKLQSTENA